MSLAARETILASGLDQLHRAGVRGRVSHVRLEQAARCAGYTTGAAYRCWATQEDFHRDLALSAPGVALRLSNADVIASVRSAVDAGVPLEEVVRVGAAANVGRQPTETDYFVPLVLRGTARFDAELAEAACWARVEEGPRGDERLHEVLLTKYQPRVRPPLTLRHLSTIIAALADGFAVQDVGCEHAHVEVDDAGPGVGADWTLLGMAVMAIVEQLTEPLTSTAPVPAAGSAPIGADPAART